MNGYINQSSDQMVAVFGILSQKTSVDRRYYLKVGAVEWSGYNLTSSVSTLTPEKSKITSPSWQQTLELLMQMITHLLLYNIIKERQARQTALNAEIPQPVSPFLRYSELSSQI